MKKISTISSQKISQLLWILLHGNTIRDTSFGDVIANIYNEMVLKIFINTIAKPHVKRSKYIRFLRCKHAIAGKHNSHLNAYNTHTIC